jgi:hypothetical protein
MDDVTGSALDSTGSGHDGGASGGPLYSQNGKLGYAVNFDGINDFFMVPDFGSGGWTNLTIEAWSRTVSSGKQHIFSKFAGGGPTVYSLNTDSGGLSEFTVSSDAVTQSVSGNVFPMATWHWLAGVWNGANIVLYENGAPQGSAPLGADLKNAGSATGIGTINGAFYWQGMIDEIRLSNVSCSKRTSATRQPAGRRARSRRTCRMHDPASGTTCRSSLTSRR